MDALVVAADHFKNGLSQVKVNSKKIILMTNFMCPTCLDENDIEKVKKLHTNCSLYHKYLSYMIHIIKMNTFPDSEWFH